MGRQAIDRTREYHRLRYLLVGITGFVGLLGVVRVAVGVQLSPGTPAVYKDPSIVIEKPVKKYAFRPIVHPTGHSVPKVTKLDYVKGRVTDLDDDGDILYLTSPLGADFRQYRLFKGGKWTLIDHLRPDIRLFLSDHGRIIEREAQLQVVIPDPIQLISESVASGYSDLKFARKFFDDGSVLMMAYTRKDGHPTYMLNKIKAGGSAQTIFSSHDELSALERTTTGTVWVRELGKTKNDEDSVWKLENGAKTKLDHPNGYKHVDRVCQTGSTLAATFGSTKTEDPFRSFVRTSAGWRELPIPNGFSMSFVEKVFYDGQILGFVTDENLKHFRQVVWDGDSVTVLDDLPVWPKRGEVSRIILASRNGNIYVRNITDLIKGTTDYTLLHVSK